MQTEMYSGQLPNGIRVNFLQTEKFKTITLGLFMHQELHEDYAALSALLPAVLEQGCQPYPDTLTLQRHLENLYGAELHTGIAKSGERHVLSFVLDLAHHSYLDGMQNQLHKGLSLLGSVVAHPLLTDGAFRPDYVSREKGQLIKDIRAMINDKTRYAQERCQAIMCEGERFGIYRLGRIEDYEAVTPAALYAYYGELLQKNPLDLYVIGELEVEEVLQAAAAALDFPRHEEIITLPSAHLGPLPREPRFFEEEMSVNQAKLVLGFRTATAYTDPLAHALLVYNGILGAFPHSKLFLKVREEAGLAYYAHSRLERHKGLLFIAAGIDAADYEEAREIIIRQLDDLAAGKISDEELVKTKRGLINGLRSRQDSPGEIISLHLDSIIGESGESPDDLIAGIEAAGPEEIRAVAGRIKLDTAYLLKPRKGEEQ